MYPEKPGMDMIACPSGMGTLPDLSPRIRLREGGPAVIPQAHGFRIVGCAGRPVFSEEGRKVLKGRVGGAEICGHDPWIDGTFSFVNACKAAVISPVDA